MVGRSVCKLGQSEWKVHSGKFDPPLHSALNGGLGECTGKASKAAYRRQTVALCKRLDSICATDFRGNGSCLCDHSMKTLPGACCTSWQRRLMTTRVGSYIPNCS